MTNEDIQTRVMLDMLDIDKTDEHTADESEARRIDTETTGDVYHLSVNIFQAIDDKMHNRSPR